MYFITPGSARTHAFAQNHVKATCRAGDRNNGKKKFSILNLGATEGGGQDVYIPASVACHCFIRVATACRNVHGIQ